ncbi:TetR/AcrR family transcriptional regulator [Deinococcus misasensis]|uniref:TetR/AcrR family transcriptional regulator n=1 Tax=Deinococcus misasensis TaxID=392413 RepID=UPI00068FA2C9|nr:TetR/AcrR family transcriptional regulator [Deinococcus misasensis]
MHDSKEHILNSALQLFLEKGFEAATMMDLVRASGFSKGAFYHHFKNKEDLYHATIEHFFLRYFQQSPLSENLSLKELALGFAGGYAQMLSEVQLVAPDLTAYYRFLFSVLPRVRPELQVFHQQARAALVLAIQRDCPQSPIPPEQAADHVLSLIEGAGVLAVMQQVPFEATVTRHLESYLKLLQSSE